jgi:hypothetical protein
MEVDLGIDGGRERQGLNGSGHALEKTGAAEHTEGVVGGDIVGVVVEGMDTVEAAAGTGDKQAGWEAGTEETGAEDRMVFAAVAELQNLMNMAVVP